MADIRLHDFEFINQQIKAQEQVEACLWQLESLITAAAVTQEFYALPKKILHGYFLVAGDLIDKAVNANQTTLNALLKQNNAQ